MSIEASLLRLYMHIYIANLYRGKIKKTIDGKSLFINLLDASV